MDILDNEYDHIHTDNFPNHSNVSVWGFTSDQLIRLIQDLNDERLWKEFCVSSLIFESKFGLTENGTPCYSLAPVFRAIFKPMYNLTDLREVITYAPNRRNYNIVYGNTSDRNTRPFSDLYSDFQIWKTNKHIEEEIASGRVRGMRLIPQSPSPIEEAQAELYVQNLLPLAMDFRYMLKEKEPAPQQETKMQDKWDTL